MSDMMVFVVGGFLDVPHDLVFAFLFLFLAHHDTLDDGPFFGRQVRQVGNVGHRGGPAERPAVTGSGGTQDVSGARSSYGGRSSWGFGGRFRGGSPPCWRRATHYTHGKVRVAFVLSLHGSLAVAVMELLKHALGLRGPWHGWRGLRCPAAVRIQPPACSAVLLALHNGASTPDRLANCFPSYWHTRCFLPVSAPANTTTDHLTILHCFLHQIVVHFFAELS